MYGFLRRPRWIAFLLLVVLIVVAFIELAAWQERRHEERRARNGVVTANADAAIVPLTSLLTPDTVVDDAVQWREVTMSGRWDDDGEVLVRNRPREGRTGYLVVTPFVPVDGPGLLVERGWVPAGSTAAERPDVPAPTSGEVDVVVRLRPAEDAKSAGDLPDGQVLRIDPALIGADLAYPVYDGFGELVSQTPEPSDDLPLPDPPTLSAGPHLGYAVQWVLFALVAVGGVVVLVRREAAYLRENADASSGSS